MLIVVYHMGLLRDLEEFVNGGDGRAEMRSAVVGVRGVDVSGLKEWSN
jgi:hypothetical protein